MTTPDLAAENRHPRGVIRRLEEDLAALQDRYTSALRQIEDLRARVLAKDGLRGAAP